MFYSIHSGIGGLVEQRIRRFEPGLSILYHQDIPDPSDSQHAVVSGYHMIGRDELSTLCGRVIEQSCICYVLYHHRSSA